MFSLIERHPVLVMFLMAVLMVAALYAADAVVELTSSLASGADVTGPAEAGIRRP